MDCSDDHGTFHRLGQGSEAAAQKEGADRTRRFCHGGVHVLDEREDGAVRRSALAIRRKEGADQAHGLSTARAPGNRRGRRYHGRGGAELQAPATVQLHAQAIGPGGRMTEAVVTDRAQPARQDMPQVALHSVSRSPPSSAPSETTLARGGLRDTLLEVRPTMKALSKSLSLLILVHWATTGSQASELVLNRPPNTSDLAQALISDQHYGAPGAGLPQRMADRFSLENPSVITAIVWWGFYLPEGASAPAQQVEFRIQMFADQQGSPAPSPFYDSKVSATLSPFMMVQEHQTYAFSATLLAPFVTQPQTHYWLSVVESDIRTDGPFRWFNSGPSQWTIGFASRPSDGDNWVVFENAEQMSFSLSGSVVLDGDADGVPDSLDQCPNTPVGAIVDAHGCSIEQLMPCAGPAAGGAWKNHGQYVSAIARTAEAFMAAGLITPVQKDAIVSAAAHSDCGRKSTPFKQLQRFGLDESTPFKQLQRFGLDEK